MESLVEYSIILYKGSISSPSIYSKMRESITNEETGFDDEDTILETMVLQVVDHSSHSPPSPLSVLRRFTRSSSLNLLREIGPAKFDSVLLPH